MNGNKEHLAQGRGHEKLSITKARSSGMTAFFNSRIDAIVRFFDRVIASPKGGYVPMVVFVTTFGVSAHLWDNQKNVVLESMNNQLDDQLSAIVYPIQGRVRMYEQLLHGINGYFQASGGHITQQSFQKYTTESNILMKYPEISGISMSYYYDHSSSFDGVMDANTNSSQSHARVMFIEPRNNSLIGFDNFSDSDRSSAMKQAQEHAMPVLSRPVRLIQKASNASPGYIMFHPIYQPGQPHISADDRQGNIHGWSAIAFQVSDLITQSSSYNLENINLRIYDGTKEDTKNLLFEIGDSSRSATSVHRTIDIGNREWTFELSSTENAERKIFHAAYFDNVLRSGVILSLILTVASFVVIRTRRESLEALCRIAGKDSTIAEMGSHDALTGLPNRSQFMKWVGTSIERTSINKKPFAVMYVDLDEFKIVNDTAGHHYGDELLRQVAGRLSECIHESDIVARQGGDEFMVGISDLRTAEDARRIAMRIIESLERPFMVFGDEFYIGSSIGVVMYPTDTQDIGAISAYADIAMYEAKNSGKNTVRFFSTDMQKRLHEERGIKDALHHAIEKKQLFLQYQPIMDARTNKVVAMETLIRWRHPKQGLIPPSKFIPIAEKNGNMIREIGLWTLRNLCAQMAIWKKDCVNVPRMNYNLSISQLRSKDVHEQFCRILGEYGIYPSEIEIEITESMLVDDVAYAMETIQKLADAGFGIALDDFGTGFSSLAYLRRLKLDTLKIDKTFIDNIVESDEDRGVVHAIITLAHGLGKKVVAEGVETKDQFELLKNMGCDCIQGYYVSRPVSADVAEQKIK